MTQRRLLATTPTSPAWSRAAGHKTLDREQDRWENSTLVEEEATGHDLVLPQQLAGPGANHSKDVKS